MASEKRIETAAAKIYSRYCVPSRQEIVEVLRECLADGAAKQLRDMAAAQQSELDELDEYNPDYFACFTGDCPHNSANQCLLSVEAEAKTTFEALRQERHQAEVYREQMAKAEAECASNKNAATYWWTRYYNSNGFERPKAFGCATEEFAASHERTMSDLERMKSEWACMARACDNWRTWPGKPVSDHDHPDWKAAAKAIIERDSLAEFARECAADRDDRISPGLKEKARKALSP